MCRGAGLIKAVEKPLALDPPSEFESFLQQVGSALEVVVDRVSSHSRCGAALLVSRLL
ncbi:conserved domain protein [Actinomyces sp. oral taxon 170 str. F0386]|nr:conserved domain protein [Actinomyces sp. oral taxon 170 str. F0386]